MADELTLVRNKFQTLNVWHNGHEFFRNGGTEDVWYWNCRRLRHPGILCHAFLHTDVGGMTGAHLTMAHHRDCPQEFARMAARQAVNRAKDMARTTSMRHSKIVKHVDKALQPAVALYFPMANSMKRVLRKSRSDAQGGIDLGDNTLEGIELTPHMIQHPSDPNRTMLLHDTGPDDPWRMMIFATDESLDLLEAQHEWFADGTFSVAPKAFKQMFTIHCRVGSSVVPCIFVLMVDQREHTYDRMLALILQERPGLANTPTHLMTDFERAEYQAFRTAFPRLRLSCCYFHLTQSVWRRVQSEGFVIEYEGDEEVALCVKMLPALAFVPPVFVLQAFNEIQNEPRCVNLMAAHPAWMWKWAQEVQEELGHKMNEILRHFHFDYHPPSPNVQYRRLNVVITRIVQQYHLYPSNYHYVRHLAHLFNLI